MKNNNSALVVALLGAVVLFAGCSGSSNPPSSSGSPGFGSGSGSGSGGGGGGLGWSSSCWFCVTSLNYVNVPTGSSKAGGLFSVNPQQPAMPITVNGSALSMTTSINVGTFHPDGAITNPFQYAVVFASNGRLWKQMAGQAASPMQISSVTSITDGPGTGASGSNAADLCNITAWPLIDYANPENSILIYRQAGTDATCGTSDDQYYWVSLNTPLTDAPTALTDLPLAPIYDANGAIANILVINGTTGALEKRDTHFGGTPTVISAGPYPLKPENQAEFTYLIDLSATKKLLLLPPVCPVPCTPGTSGELRIVDTSTNTLTGALGTVGKRAVWFDFTNDSQYVYFVANNASGTSLGVVQRFPVDGSAAATNFHDFGSVSIGFLFGTPNSIVFQQSDGSGHDAVVAAPKSGVAPVTLATATSVGESLWVTEVSSTGYVYYNRVGATFSAHTAEAIKENGTGKVVNGSTNGAEWNGNHYPTFNLYTEEYYPDRLVLVEYAASATDYSGATLSVVNADTTTKNGVLLGAMPAGMRQFFVTMPFGSTAGIWTDIGPANDVYFTDIAVAGSLTRVTNDAVNQQIVY